ncbi:MerR family DNA-binding transcriptional regulator [Segeticoccus rhizosphaerae]|uniref:MerR family DNA-binding transcriptional regulator n=1 Tax=Segeticoccus rhizosphaerae TaxID=1104777 RepID=UPI00192E5481|nr:MerR family DNA-binding transcriptional regulator [Ornithinicoccus soli]
MSAAARPGEPMTIGVLSRRTRISVKALREYEDAGLIYSLGRSPGNYRLFGEEALWCVQAVTGMRSLGLTLAEVTDITHEYLRDPSLRAGPLLATALGAVRSRTQARILELQTLLGRVADFEQEHAEVLAGRSTFDFRDNDPRFRRRA